RFPEGVKTTRASLSASLTITSAGRSARCPSPPALPPTFAPARLRIPRRGLAELPYPAPTVRVDAVQHIGGHHAHHLLWVQRIHDCRGHAGPGRHGQEGGIQV